MSIPTEVVMPGAIQNGDVDFLEDDEMNGNVEKGSQPIRIIRKAKRTGQASPGKDVPPAEGGSAVQNHTIQPYSKNSRKSRSGRGRGDPKKGGAGGKGTWGAPGDELFEDGSCRDARDPNYDSDSQDEYVVEKIEPVVSDEELIKILEPLILEYFEHGKTEEVETSLHELNLGPRKPKVIQTAINLALDRKATHREMTSVLISDLCGQMLSYKDLANGFDELLKSLTDLTIDTPDAPTVVGQFVARAVADDCLPPKFIHSYKGNVECVHHQAALEKAELLLSQKHGIVRLDNIWGTGGGIRPVKYLTKQMVLLLKEYLSSGDISEATRCLRELEVPHFHHELVYEASVMVLEEGSERAAARMCQLLKSLNDSGVISPQQMSQGFQRVFDNLPDICLDVPTAYTIMDRFAELCHREGVLSDALYKELPQRGRKRFVSEGDGGKVKEPTL